MHEDPSIRLLANLFSDKISVVLVFYWFHFNRVLGAGSWVQGTHLSFHHSLGIVACWIVSHTCVYVHCNLIPYRNVMNRCCLANISHRFGFWIRCIVEAQLSSIRTPNRYRIQKCFVQCFFMCYGLPFVRKVYEFLTLCYLQSRTPNIQIIRNHINYV